MYWQQVNIDSGNGLVPSGNKLLPELMSTQIFSSYDFTRSQWMNNKSALGQEMAVPFDKPLYEPMLTKFHDGVCRDLETIVRWHDWHHV